MSLRFCPLASGSSGNCAFVMAGGVELLVDVGVSGVAVERAMESIGGNAEKLRGLLITHEHSDHVQGVGVVSRRYNVPVFATPGTWEAMGRYKQLGAIAKENKKVIYPGRDFYIGDTLVSAFEIPHDANQPVGYSFCADGYKVTVATDIGEPTETIKENLKDSDALLLESNHDVDMLRSGSYSAQLKRRILGKNGHLSNVNAGLLLCDVFSERLKHVFLGHLSEENNRPLIAFDTVNRILNANDVKTNCDGGVRLSVAERYTASCVVELD